MDTPPHNRIAGLFSDQPTTIRSLGNGIVLISKYGREGERSNALPPTATDTPSEFGDRVYGVALIDQGGVDVGLLVYGDTATAQPDGALVVSRRDGKPNVMIAPGIWRYLCAITPEADMPTAIAGWRPM